MCETDIILVLQGLRLYAGKQTSICLIHQINTVNSLLVLLENYHIRKVNHTELLVLLACDSRMSLVLLLILCTMRMLFFCGEISDATQDRNGQKRW